MSSGIFFRVKSNDKWINKEFEDLSEQEQDEVMSEFNEQQLKALAKALAKTLNNIKHYTKAKWKNFADNVVK